MRYYSIAIGSGNGALNYTSHPNGVTQPPDPGALQVELDILQYNEDTPGNNSLVRVWGIGIQTIGQATDLNNKVVTVMGGMGKGLPLANPAQVGVLVKGTINQAFGNWQGVNQTLDLILRPGTGSDLPKVPTASNPPNNLTLDWRPNTPLSQAIAATLKLGFPSYKQVINISPNLVRPNHEAGFYGNLEQFAKYIREITLPMLGGSYLGVAIHRRDDTFYVYDNASQQQAGAAGGTGASSGAKTIAFNDLIGQVTWIGLREVQINCVMRGDIKVSDKITLPPGQQHTTAQSSSQFRDASIFQGTFLVKSIRHVGNFRQPDGTAWITTINAFAA